MAPADAAPSPALLVREELAGMQEFVSVLKEEQEALVAGQGDALPLLAERKASITTRLNEMANRRLLAQGRGGFGIDRRGFEAWIGPDTETRTLGATLLVNAEKARILNDINGRLVSQRLQANQQALGILLSAARLPSLYGQNGQHTASAGGRSLGSA